jgi:hypothetical protein
MFVMTLTNKNWEQIKLGEFMVLSVYESELFLSKNPKTETNETNIFLG